MTPDTVRRIAMKTLALTDSFIGRSRLNNQFIASASLYSKNAFIGLYLNSPDSHLVITEKGVEVIWTDHKYFINYSDITQITSPGPDDRDLDVLVENDRVDGVRSYAIPVLGVTNDVADIEEFYNFLLAITEYLGINPVTLRSISSMKDLIAYLRVECQWDEYTGALANYLEDEFHVQNFEAVDIDKVIFEKPDFWRAVAVLLDVPIKMPLEKVRDLRGWENSAEFN